MSLLESFEKHSSEQYSKTISFLDRMPTGASVVSASVLSALDTLDGTNYTAGASAVVGIPTTTATSTTLLFKNGTDGRRYLITLKTNLSDGSALTDLIEMRVRDAPL